MCTMKKTLDFEDYKLCLLAGLNAFREQPLFRNKLHEVHAVEVNKLALSRDNDKGMVQSDGMSTLAYGYKEASTTDVFRNLSRLKPLGISIPHLKWTI